MIVAADLECNDKGKVVVGKETKIACDRASELVHAHKDCIVVMTAGEARGKWNHIWMAEIMADYMKERGLPNNLIVYRKAGAFNTDGEMRELVEFAKPPYPAVGSWANGPSEIILVVKWWHAYRSKWLCRYRLKKAGLDIPVSVSECPSYARIGTVLREPIAMIENRLRILIHD